MLETAALARADGRFPTWSVLHAGGYNVGHPDLSHDVRHRHTFILSAADADAIVAACPSLDAVRVARALSCSASLAEAVTILTSERPDETGDADATDADADETGDADATDADAE
jgi:hypothetical protein